MFVLLYPKWNYENAHEVALATLFGFILLFSLTMQYYDRATRHEGGGAMHAGRRSVIAGFIFASSHLFLGYFMLIAVQGIVEVCNSVRADDGKHIIRYGSREFLCYGCMGTAFLIHYQRILHDGLYAQFATVIDAARYIINFIISSMHFALLGTDIPPLNQLFAHALIALSVVLVDMSCDLILGHTEEKYSKADNHDHSTEDSSEGKHGKRPSVRKSLQAIAHGVAGKKDIESTGDVDHAENRKKPHLKIIVDDNDLSVNLTGVPIFPDGKDPEASILDEVPEGDESSDDDENAESNVPNEFHSHRRASLEEIFGSEDVETFQEMLSKIPEHVLLRCLKDRLVK
jgi:hypothetical protein